METSQNYKYEPRTSIVTSYKELDGSNHSRVKSNAKILYEGPRISIKPTENTTVNETANLIDSIHKQLDSSCRNINSKQSLKDLNRLTSSSHNEGSKSSIDGKNRVYHWDRKSNGENLWNVIILYSYISIYVKDHQTQMHTIPPPWPQPATGRHWRVHPQYHIWVACFYLILLQVFRLSDFAERRDWYQV